MPISGRCMFNVTDKNRVWSVSMNGIKKASIKENVIIINKYFAFSVVFYILSLYLFLYEFRGLGALFLLVIDTLLSLIIIIVGIIYLRKKKHHTILLIGICLLITNWTSVFIAQPIHDYELSITQERGNTIIKAIDSYYEDNKSYPKNLDELSKQHYIIVPMTYHIAAKGDKFLYYQDEEGGYVLSYNKDPYIPMRYYSRNKQWHVEPLG